MGVHVGSCAEKSTFYEMLRGFLSAGCSDSSMMCFTSGLGLPYWSKRFVRIRLPCWSWGHDQSHDNIWQSKGRGSTMYWVLTKIEMFAYPRYKYAYTCIYRYIPVFSQLFPYATLVNGRKVQCWQRRIPVCTTVCFTCRWSDLNSGNAPVLSRCISVLF